MLIMSAFLHFIHAAPAAVNSRAAVFDSGGKHECRPHALRCTRNSQRAQSIAGGVFRRGRLDQTFSRLRKASPSSVGARPWVSDDKRVIRQTTIQLASGANACEIRSAPMYYGR